MKFSTISNVDTSEWAPAELLDFLRDSRWATFCDFIADGIIVVDCTGMVQYMNAAAEGINELTRDQCLGRPLSELVRQSNTLLPGIPAAFQNSQRLNDNVVDPAGRRIAISCRPIRDAKGLMTCYLVNQRNLDLLLRSPTNYRLNDLEAARSDEESATVAGVTEASARLLAIGTRAMTVGSRILILGESGVGKSEFARLLHRGSSRAGGPFIHVNCASIPDTLFESEMFGYDRGSFTGANSKGKAGLIESADGGTLFLDEIGETPLHLQAKLLQVLESGTVQRLGATSPRRVQINVIAATNRDLKDYVVAGKFRQDLYYRLSVVALSLPPLRDQKELIDPLIDHFLRKINKRLNTPLDIPADCRGAIKKYSFPGNIRELQNLVEYLCVVCERTARLEDLPAELRAHGQAYAELMRDDRVAENILSGPPAEGVDLKALVRDFEGKIIADAIRKTGSKRKAAALLNTDIATIVRKSNRS